MRNNELKGKYVKRTILLTALVIGVSSLTFQGFTQAATKEYNKTETIATTYTDIQDIEFEAEPETKTETEVATESKVDAEIENEVEPHAEQNSLPEGYKKANYKIGSIDLVYYSKQAPASKDMSREEAAEIGAQALWSIFDVNLEGQVIEMGYDKGNENLPRSSWTADVLIDGKRSYYFQVDAVTGDLFGIGRYRTLAINVSVAYDVALAENYSEYADLAMNMAIKCDVVHGEVTSVEYNSQGYSSNDPDITFDIKGENGEIAIMTFSRYDKALIGIGFYAQYKYTLAEFEKIEQEATELQ